LKGEMSLVGQGLKCSNMLICTRKRKELY
jgi:hypothetical protein